MRINKLLDLNVLSIGGGMRWLFYITVALLYSLLFINAGGSIQGGGGLQIGAVLLFFLGCYYVVLASRSQTIVVPRLVLWWLPFLSYLVISWAMFSLAPWYAVLLIMFAVVAYGFLWWVASLEESVFQEIVPWGWGVLLFIGFVSVLVGMYHYYVDYSWYPIGAGVFQYENRAASLLAQPNEFACYMLMLIPGVMVATHREGAKMIARVGFAVLGLFYIYGVCLSVSRAGFLTLIPLLCCTAFFVEGSWRRRMLIAGAWVASFVVIYLLMFSLGGGDARIEGMVKAGGESARKALYPAAWELFLESPVFGGGLGSFQMLWDKKGGLYGHSEWHVHNDLLELMADMGGLGVLLFFIPIVRLLWPMLKGGEIERSGLRDSCLMGLLAFGVHTQLNFHTKVLALLILAVLFLGVLARGFDVVVLGRKAVGLLSAVMILSSCWVFVGGHVLRIWSDAGSRNKQIAEYVEGGGVVEQAAFAELREDYARVLSVWPGFVPAWKFGSELCLWEMYAYPDDSPELIRTGLAWNAQAIKYSPHDWRLVAQKADLLDRIAGGEGYVDKAYQDVLRIAPRNLEAWMLYAEFLYEVNDSGRLEQVLNKMQGFDLKIMENSESAEAYEKYWAYVGEKELESDN